MSDIVIEAEAPHDRIIKADISDQMNKAFVDYAMSVITNRAVPDVRDGLKPVHRRIIYLMYDADYHHNKPYKKSARIVGDVMGRLHPHGDAAIYDALVRLAQDFSVMHTLVDGQGNFGSIDGDNPAAPRYTEARMTALAHMLTADVGFNTVGMKANYDGRETEPLVLPARYPNLLVNGQQGIAVGMATSIPTHNLAETLDACLLMLDNPNASVDDILQVMPGPDFPSGGVIMGKGNIREAYLTGRGSIVQRGVYKVEEAAKKKQLLILTEVPYGVNHASLMETISKLVNDKEIIGITNINDEKGKHDNCRIVLELKSDADVTLIVNQLYKRTEFQKNFSYNATCLNSKGRPGEMGITEMIGEFVAFRYECVTKRTIYLLDKARDKQIRQIALYAAVGLLDEVIQIIRSSSDEVESRSRLMQLRIPTTDELAEILAITDPDYVKDEFFHLSDIQADAILAIRLSQLTRLGQDVIAGNLREIAAEINSLLAILHDPLIMKELIRTEFNEIKAKFGQPRKTLIEASEADELDENMLVECKDIIITLSNTGYIKRTDLSSYRSQKRGGKGKIGMETKEEDFVISSTVCTTRQTILLFTAKGMAYQMKAHRFQDAAPNAKGRPIVNYIDLKEGDSVRAMIALPEDKEALADTTLIFVTNTGNVRRSEASAFLDIRRNGKICMGLDDDSGQNPSIITVLIADDKNDLILTSNNGNAVRFPVSDLRVIGSTRSLGVRGISLRGDDELVSAEILPATDAESIERDVYLSGGITYYTNDRYLKNEHGEFRAGCEHLIIESAANEEHSERIKVELKPHRMNDLKQSEVMILSVSEKGYGKRSSSHEYRSTSRAGTGFAAANLNDKTGKLVGLLTVNENDEIILITDNGQTIKTRVSEVSVQGRSTAGLRLLSVPDGQKIVSAVRIENEEEQEEFDDITE